MAVSESRRMIDEASVDELDQEFRGELFQPGDTGYEQARRIWNSMIDKRPALIARCAGTADVVTALRFGRDQELTITVRGGGHNVAGNALCNDGLVIDLSAMTGIHVDVEERRARVQSGATWADLDQETQLHGLMTPGGAVSTTGVAGFTLSGGMGLARRKWALACDNLLSVEIVTANGEVVTASESHHPDLFWAIRGGGGNFGIVTSFEFRLHSLGPEMYIAAAIYSPDDAGILFRKWRRYAEQAPNEVTTDVLFWNTPDMPHVDRALIGQPIFLVVGWYAGPADEGARILAPLRQLGAPLADLSHVGRYVDIQRILDPFLPDTQRYYWKSLFVDRLSDDVLDAIVEVGNDRRSPQSAIAFRQLGGAISDVSEEATAYGNRQAGYNVSLDTCWVDPADDQRMIEWTRQSWAKLHDLTGGGVYLNFAGLGEENDALAQSGYGSNYDRMREVKRRYDPSNVFQGNVNVKP